MKKNRNLLRYWFICIILIVTVAPVLNVNGARNGAAINSMKSLLNAGNESEPVEPSDDVENVDEKEESKENNNSSCGPEQIIPIEICELGQGFLCLNTPDLSVDEDYIIVKGTVDKRTSVFSHFRVFAQHEYTKKFEEVKIGSIASTDCWEGNWSDVYSACIDQKGFFGVKVPLKERGPYTIMIDAVSMNGEAVSEKVRSSRVVAPELKRENISFEPNPFGQSENIDSRKIKVKVDLLGDCKFCDFVGTATGGLDVYVTNRITNNSGKVKKIVRRGNIATAGVVEVCLPVLSGKNTVTVAACNAAASEDNCSVVDEMSFNASTEDKSISIISPEEDKLLYRASNYSVIPLKFSVSGDAHPTGSCQDGDVEVVWNRYKPVSLCPDSDGLYTARLIPQVGINVGTITINDNGNTISKSFSVGWGKIVNPFLSAGWVADALRIDIGESYLNDTLRPVINEFLTSDQFGEFVKTLLSSSGVSKNEEVDPTKLEEQKLINDKINVIKGSLPHCEASEGGSSIKMDIVGDPIIKWALLKELEFKDSAVGFKLNAEGVEVHLKIYKDEDSNGIPDTNSVLPLMIGFKGTQIAGKVEYKPEGKPLFLLTSDFTDCDYRRSSFCEKKPSLLIPQNIVGSATKSGAFVRCDDKNQQMSGSEKSDCVSLNILNGQTGLISQKVLDFVNDLLYCQGSAYLTYVMRERIKDIHTHIGCDTVGGSTCEINPLIGDRSIWIGGGLDPFGGDVTIDGNGIQAYLPAKFGTSTLIDNMDENVKSSEVGVLTDTNLPEKMIGEIQERLKRLSMPNNADLYSISSDSISFSISTGLINELLFSLAFQKEGSGLLDWEIDEVFFNSLGFDAVKECDAFDPFESEADNMPTLCQLRPRIGEMLGADLTTNGYFSQRDPIRLKMVGSRTLAPHVRVYKTDVPYEVPAAEGEEEGTIEYRPAEILELQLPDIDISFYALEIDEVVGKDGYGNPQLLYDESGDPVVHSMIEDAEEPAPILRVRGTIILPLEVGKLQTSIEDPTKLEIELRPVPAYVQIVFKSIDGGNSTIVSDSNLLEAFTSKINYGLSEYGAVDENGDPKNPIVLSIPKSFSLDFLDNSDFGDIFSKLGLEKLSFGSDGLSLNLDYVNERVGIKLKPMFQSQMD